MQVSTEAAYSGVHSLPGGGGRQSQEKAYRTPLCRYPSWFQSARCVCLSGNAVLCVAGNPAALPTIMDGLAALSS